MNRPFALRLATFVIVVLGLLVAAPAAVAHHGSGHHRSSIHPMIFVHGSTGSGAQFASQKMRFTENGYPDDYVRVFEYDSTFSVESQADVQARLDSFIAEVKRGDRPQAGRSTGSLAGHLRFPDLPDQLSRARRERRPLREHRRGAGGLSAGRGTDSGHLGGYGDAGSLDRRGDQRHRPQPDARPVGDLAGVIRCDVQVLHRPSPPYHRHPATARQDHDRRTGDAVPAERRRPGRHHADDLEGEEFKRRADRRIRLRPRHWRATGPGDRSRVRSGKRYEFALEQQGQVHHFFYERFRRSDHLIRLLTNVPGTSFDLILSRSENHVDLIMLRYKELWGDQGAENDVLTVNGTNVINAATSPISHRTNAMFAFDQGSDGQSNVSAPIPVFFGIPFLSAVDLFIPAASPPTGTVRVDLRLSGVRAHSRGELPQLPVVQQHGHGAVQRLRALVPTAAQSSSACT